MQAVAAMARGGPRIEWRVDALLVGTIVALVGFSLVMVFSVIVSLPSICGRTIS